MKSIIFKSNAIFLGLLILFSSLGFTVSTHFCGGKKIMAAVGFVKTDLTCGMKSNPNLCTEKNQIKSSCCLNVFDYHHLEDNVKKERVEIFVPNLTHSFTQIELIPRYKIALKRTRFNDFSPPLIVKNITLFHQAFLI